MDCVEECDNICVLWEMWKLMVWGVRVWVLEVEYIFFRVRGFGDLKYRVLGELKFEVLRVVCRF